MEQVKNRSGMVIHLAKHPKFRRHNDNSYFGNEYDVEKLRMELRMLAEQREDDLAVMEKFLVSKIFSFLPLVILLLLPATGFAETLNLSVDTTKKTCSVEDGASPLPTPSPPVTVAPTPTSTASLMPVQQWETIMTQYGKQHCDKAAIDKVGIADTGVSYYDGARVYYQVADYTGDKSYETCAGYVRNVYRPYALKGGTPGWRVFAAGLGIHYKKARDQLSLDAIKKLTGKSAFAVDNDWVNTNAPKAENSREVAYLIEAYLEERKITAALNPRITKLVTWSKGHLDQWLKGAVLKPFMAALTSEALIQYYEEEKQDAAIQTLVSRIADFMWTKLWVEDAQSFKYIDRVVSGEDPPDPSPDLNLLIAPLYSWLYKETGDEKWKVRFEKIFTGGVNNAYWVSGKVYSQSFRWSIQGLEWAK